MSKLELFSLFLILCLSNLSESTKLEQNAIFESYEKLIWNKQLVDSILDWSHPVSLIQCAKECFRFGGCMSFNYIPKLLMCDINIGDHDTHPGKFTSRYGCIYGQRKHLRKNILDDKCRERTCKTGAKCMENGNETLCDLQACPAAPRIRYADLKSQHTKIGHTAQYTCHHGYHVSGSLDFQLECKSDGTWQNILKCVPIPCPEPPHVPNAHVVSKTLAVGGSTIYSCNFGYHPSKFSVIKCRLGPSWTDVHLTCVIKCPSPPPSISFGHFYPDWHVYVAGNIVRYYCHSHNIIQGNDTIVCQDNGQWSDVTATCSYYG